MKFVAYAMMIAAAAPGLAQSATAELPEKTGLEVLEEIVVTATKRPETLLKAPLAVTALSQAQLQESGVEGLQSLTSSAPAVEVRTVGLGNAIQITVRGISNSDFNESANPAVATYVDGVYVGRTEGLNGAFYDLERVEVLRGPQGTLYGRNSTGGNVNIITTDPKDVFGAAADVSYGNHADVQMHGMLNVPVSDTLAIRGAVVVHRNSGLIDTQDTTTRNYQQADDYGARLTALWTPSENFKWRLSADNFISNGTPGLDILTGPDGKPADGYSAYSRPVSNVPEPYNYLNNLMVRSRMDWRLTDTLSLAYIAGYQNVQATPQTVEDFIANLYREELSETQSHEFNLSYDTGRLHNIVGATYFRQLYSQPGDADLFNLGLLFLSHAKVMDTAWGVFDQATFNITDSLRVIGGIRYSSEKIAMRNAHQTFCSLADYPPSEYPIRRLVTPDVVPPGCLDVPSAGVGTSSSDGKWSNTNWKAGLAYDFSDTTSTYLTVTTGFKSGGLNIGSNFTPDQFTFKPEQVINYEAGFKTRLLDNRASINAAVFYENYSDLQVTQLAVTNGALGNITLNAAKARIYGLEVEGQWHLTDQDRISGFYSYLNATYTNYQNAVDQLTGNVVPSLVGNSLPHSPKSSTRIQYSHDFTLSGGGTLTPTVAVYWQSTSYLREFNLPIDRVDSYSKTHLDLTYNDVSGHWKTTAYVDNLENKEVRNGGFAFFGYFSDYHPPRSYGVRLSYTY